MAAPPPATAPYTPKARARSFGSVNVTVSSDSEAGAITAANAPCNARAPKSMAPFCAKPPRAEAAAKPRRLMMNIRLRPMKSAIRPPISNRPPNANVYAVKAHWRLAIEMCRARWAEGRAIVTTEASRTIIS